MDNPKKGSKRIPVSSAFLYHPTVPVHLDEPSKSDQTGTLRLHVPVRAFLRRLFSSFIRGETRRSAWMATWMGKQENL
jgi:hypothetical protein